MAGRPRMWPERTALHIALPPSLHREITEIAEDLGVSRAAVARAGLNAVFELTKAELLAKIEGEGR